MTQLEGKSALVVGGSAGIGLAIAQRFASEGAHVYITGRRMPQLDEAAEHVGAGCTPIQGDVAKLEDIDLIFERIAADGRRLDALVISAASSAGTTAAETTLDQYNEAFDTNVRGALFTLQKALPLLNDHGSVLLFDTLASGLGYAGSGAYSASKAAISAYARVWARELAPRGIRVNTLTPGATRTPLLMSLAVSDPAQAGAVFDAMGSALPLGRVADPSDLANAALFLASAQAAHITGTNLTVDGGQALGRTL
jgi:NAD(P)-dependent dehydrogenase (short-subunit alcohol dehydrogenase family)